MKVLARKDRDTYICEIKHSEIEKFLNRYYKDKDLHKLAVDEVVDLGKGHDFLNEIKSALRKTEEFFKSHESTVKAIANGFLLGLNEPENLDLTLSEDLD